MRRANMTWAEALRILGIDDDNPTADEIKSAYRDAISVLHPDNHHNKRGRKFAEEQTKKINEAYQFLETIGFAPPAGSSSSKTGTSSGGGTPPQTANSNDNKQAPPRPPQATPDNGKKPSTDNTVMNKRCRKCGHMNKTAAMFCKKCGANLKTQRIRRISIATVCGVLLVAIIAVAITVDWQQPLRSWDSAQKESMLRGYYGMTVREAKVAFDRDFPYAHEWTEVDDEASYDYADYKNGSAINIGYSPEGKNDASDDAIVNIGYTMYYHSDGAAHVVMGADIPEDNTK